MWFPHALWRVRGFPASWLVVAGSYKRRSQARATHDSQKRLVLVEVQACQANAAKLCVHEE